MNNFINSEINPISISRQIIIQEVGNEIFIYEMHSNKIWCLNETCSFIWEMCDGTNSVSDITKAISTKFKVIADESLVWLTLDSLTKAGLLENGEEVMQAAAGNNFSRRETIKRVGLTTMLALPFISTIIAPTAAQAQSACIAPSSLGCVFDNFTQSDCCDSNQRCRNPVFGTICVNCNSGDQVKTCGFVGCCTGIPEANRCCTGPIIEREFFGNPGNYFCICP